MDERIGVSTLFRSCAIPPASGADALEALGAEELRLELPLLGDVDVHREHCARLAVCVAQQAPVPCDEERPPLLVHLGELAAPVADRDGALLRRTCLREPGCVRAVEERCGLAPEDVGGGPAVEPRGAAVPVGDAVVQIADEDRFARLVEERRLLAHLLLGPVVLLARAEADDAEGQVVRQLLEELELVYPSGADLRGHEGDQSEGPRGVTEREA